MIDLGPWSLGRWTTFFLLETTLVPLILLAIAIYLLIHQLPSGFEIYAQQIIDRRNFSEQEKQDEDSGYEYLIPVTDRPNYCRPKTSVTIFVVGDIGRSPRMQYHACSIAKYGGRVQLVGYLESDVLPELRDHQLVSAVHLQPLPEWLSSSAGTPFLIKGPLKALHQAWTIFHTLGYRTEPSKYLLLQNPPSVPTFLIAWVIGFLRNERVIIDWHNLGHTILGLKLGPRHPLVRLYEIHDRWIGRFIAESHIAVSDAMQKLLRRSYGVSAVTLHDRPAAHFQPISPETRAEFLRRCQGTKAMADELISGIRKLIVSSTSWTVDEDFSILLDALVKYAASASGRTSVPKLEVIVTGKGPLKQHYLDKIAQLEKQGKLTGVNIQTAWLSIQDYALLLASADLGISLHTSSSGIDLPMKVVDMFGAGLPVIGWDNFEAWPELVQEGINGRGFRNAEGLEKLLVRLFEGGKSGELAEIKRGAMVESGRRWGDEWLGVAKLFGLEGEGHSQPITI